MTPQNFRDWRKKMMATQAEAAHFLGVSQRTVAAWEGSESRIPKHVELACAALKRGLTSYPRSPFSAEYDTFSNAAESLLIAARCIVDSDGKKVFVRGDGVRACEAVAAFLSETTGFKIDVPAELLGGSSD